MADKFNTTRGFLPKNADQDRAEAFIRRMAQGKRADSGTPYDKQEELSRKQPRGGRNPAA